MKMKENTTSYIFHLTSLLIDYMKIVLHIIKFPKLTLTILPQDVVLNQLSVDK